MTSTTTQTAMTVEERRAEVARLHSEGLSSRKIGAQLGISEATARRALAAVPAGVAVETSTLSPDTNTELQPTATANPAQPQPSDEYETAQAALRDAQSKLSALYSEKSGIDSRVLQALSSGDGTAMHQGKSRGEELDDAIAAQRVVVARAQVAALTIELDQAAETVRREEAEALRLLDTIPEAERVYMAARGRYAAQTYVVNMSENNLQFTRQRLAEAQQQLRTLLPSTG